MFIVLWYGPGLNCLCSAWSMLSWTLQPTESQGVSCLSAVLSSNIMYLSDGLFVFKQRKVRYLHVRPSYVAEFVCLRFNRRFFTSYFRFLSVHITQLTWISLLNVKFKNTLADPPGFAWGVRLKKSLVLNNCCTVLVLRTWTTILRCMLAPPRVGLQRYTSSLSLALSIAHLHNNKTVG